MLVAVVVMAARSVELLVEVGTEAALYNTARTAAGDGWGDDVVTLLDEGDNAAAGGAKLGTRQTRTTPKPTCAS